MVGFFLVLGASALWAVDTLIRYPLINKGVGSFSVVFYEHLILSSIFLIIFYKKIPSFFKIPRKHVLYFFIVGAIGSGFSTLAFTKAFHFLNPSLVILLQKFQPVVAISLASVILKERVGPMFILWAIICILGAFLISYDDIINLFSSRANFLTIINNHIKPNKIKINHKFYNPNVLVAGCGTGNHLCQTANYLNANILGVDLSLRSLAYAKRKVEELGLKNIDFLHADILQLKDLKKKFDVIECVGVLHHMHDPPQGLKILVDLLEPNGLLLIGLYSEKARQDVIKAKDFAKKNKFENSFSGIRSFREAIFKEKNDLELKRLATGRDFYSISSVKDLIFHAQEYRFTLPEIFKMLENLNLEFLGFCDSKVKNKYSKLFRNDKKNTSFSNWNEFETLEPLAFFKMYTFWVRKK